MEVSRAREVALRENRRLQDDLSSMMKENQASRCVGYGIVAKYVVFNFLIWWVLVKGSDLE